MIHTILDLITIIIFIIHVDTICGELKLNFGATIKTLKFLFPDIIIFIIVVSSHKAKLEDSGKISWIIVVLLQMEHPSCFCGKIC